MPWHSQSISNLVSNEIRFVVVAVYFFCFVIGYNLNHGPLFYLGLFYLGPLNLGLLLIID